MTESTADWASRLGADPALWGTDGDLESDTHLLEFDREMYFRRLTVPGQLPVSVNGFRIHAEKVVVRPIAIDGEYQPILLGPSPIGPVVNYNPMDYLNDVGEA